MVLDLNTLPLLGNEEGYSFSEDLQLQDIRLWGGHPIKRPVQAEGRLFEKSGILCLELSVSYRIEGECGRCLTAAERPGAFQASHIVMDHLPYEDAEGEYIEAPHGRLDVDALIREDLLLELPQELLCDEECAGLCPQCGRNLNEGDCGCPDHEPDPRFDILRKLMEDHQD